MIITRLMGGHSNQLFQYAMGRSLAISRNTNLKLDVSWFDQQPQDAKYPRHYELDCYPIKAEIATKADLKQAIKTKIDSSLLQKIFHKKSNLPPLKTINEASLSFDPKLLQAPDGSYLIGYWQNENYFKSIREELLQEFEPTTKMSESNKAYLKQISNCEAVALHVRREDYVGVDAFNKYHGLASMEYYQKAIEQVSQHASTSKLQLFIFSTDMDWCKKNLEFNYPMVFVEGNSDGADDMRLMKHCKHNVMANSSFSWWGAWLNQNPNKVVVAPKVWFKDTTANQQMQLPEDWIRL